MFFNNFNTTKNLNVKIVIVDCIQIVYDRKLIKAYRKFMIFI